MSRCLLTASELDIASQIQKDVLPKEAPDSPGLDIVAKNRAAAEVGGDSFDFLSSPDGNQTFIYIGDVTGHGVVLAMLVYVCAISMNVTDIGVVQEGSGHLKKAAGSQNVIRVVPVEQTPRAECQPLINRVALSSILFTRPMGQPRTILFYNLFASICRSRIEDNELQVWISLEQN